MQAEKRIAYFIPEAQLFFNLSRGSLSLRTHIIPDIVKTIPIHTDDPGDSFKKTTAIMTVNTGPKVSNNRVSLGPKRTRALKKNVSPKVIPSKPLNPMIKNAFNEKKSMPVNNKAIKTKKEPVIALQKLAPTGVTFELIFCSKTEHTAKEAAEKSAARLPIIHLDKVKENIKL